MRNFRIPQSYEHYLFGIMQSAITFAVATGITTFRTGNPTGSYMLLEWFYSWGVSWLIMLPVVIFFTPFLRKGVRLLTR
jgi:hypothetical protein